MIESTRRHLLPWRVPRCRVLPARWRSGHQVTGCLPAYKCTGADVRIRHEQGLGCITLACEWKVSYMRSKSKGHTGCQCRSGGRVGILPYHRTSWYGFYSPAGCTCLTNHALGLLPECFSSRPTGGRPSTPHSVRRCGEGEHGRPTVGLVFPGQLRETRTEVLDGATSVRKPGSVGYLGVTSCFRGARYETAAIEDLLVGLFSA